MSNNLAITQLASNQNNKEATINDQMAEADAALTEVLPVAVTSANAVTLTSDQFRRNVTVHLAPDGADPPTAAITLITPDVKRGLFLVENATGRTVTVQSASQTATAPSMPDGQNRLLVNDGTDVHAATSGVKGPASATDNALARFDGASGTVVQDSNATLDDAGNLVLTGGLTLGSDLPISEGGTGASTASGARSNLDVPGLSVQNTFLANQAVKGTGNTFFTIESDKNVAGRITINLSRALNANNQVTEFARLTARDDDPTAGSEQGAYVMETTQAGVVASEVITYKQGAFYSGAAGTDQGQGTINMTALYDDGVQITCMVLEYERTGTFDPAPWDDLVPDRETPAQEVERPRTVKRPRPVERVEMLQDGTRRIVREAQLVDEPVFEMVEVVDGTGAPTGEVRQLPVTDTVTRPARTEPRRNELAHTFRAMLDDGFDPRDPAAYMAKLRAEGALPGMVTRAEWADRMTRMQAGEKGVKPGVGETISRLWIALEFLAVAWMRQAEDHETRIAALEAGP